MEREVSGVIVAGRREQAAMFAKDDWRGRSVSRRSEVDDAEYLDGDDGVGQYTDEPAEAGDEPVEADQDWSESPTDAYVVSLGYLSKNRDVIITNFYSLQWGTPP